MPRRPPTRVAAPEAEVRAVDRRIAALAIPAAIGLLTDPLYDLVDTAILGHLGTHALAGAAIAMRILSFGYATFVFVLFATTATVARRMGAGSPRHAVEAAVGAMWVGLALGVGAAAIIAVSGPTLIGWFGGRGPVADDAWTYLWISVLGFPALLMVMAGVGYRRGIERPRLPLIVALVSVAVNLVAELALILGLGFGVGASAATTVAVKWGSAITYVGVVRRAAKDHRTRWRPSAATVRDILAVGRPLVVRTTALLATVAAATALAARHGTAALAAHSIAFAIWSFSASVSDGTEVAGQTLVAHGLGMGSRHAAELAMRRVLRWAALVGLALATVVVGAGRLGMVRLFTDDPRVEHITSGLLWWVALAQPLNALAFSLDGVLIGAGRQRELAGIMLAAAAAFGVAAGVGAAAHAGLWSVWAGLLIFMIVRLSPAWWLARGTLRGPLSS